MAMERAKAAQEEHGRSVARPRRRTSPAAPAHERIGKLGFRFCGVAYAQPSMSMAFPRKDPNGILVPTKRSDALSPAL
jgi:hypothetical protein